MPFATIRLVTKYKIYEIDKLEYLQIVVTL